MHSGFFGNTAAAKSHFEGRKLSFGSSLPNYRPDIDGLRAIAISTVVLYHAFPSVLPGGFVGVDIFFVISGFLISGIVFTQMTRGTFSFQEFYVRRICRIFPALVIVLSITAIIGWTWLLPGDWERLGQEIRGGAFFFANFVFLSQAGYFDEASIMKPLLHLWSLSIEEQFYLVWPIVALLAYRIRGAIPLLLLIGILTSFAFNLKTITTNPVAAFYLPGTRAWELLVGCLLAYRSEFDKGVLARRLSAIEGAFAPELRAFCGLGLIAVAALCFDSHQPYPGWRALFPTIGAALLIAAGPRAIINRTLLASRPMIFVGLISYPLYLWHWPILSFVTIYEGGVPGIQERLGLVLLAFACAVATFYLIERPIRFGRKRRQAAAILALFCATLGGVGSLIIRDTIQPNASRYGVDRIVAASSDWAYPTVDLDSESYRGRVVRKSKYAKGDEGFLFFGDSNMEMYWPRVEALAKRRDISKRDAIYFLTFGGCPPIPDVTEASHPYCAGFVDDALQLIRERNIKTVVIGAHWWGYLSHLSAYRFRGERLSTDSGSVAALRALAEMVRSIVAEGCKVFVVLNIPYDGKMDPKNMVKRHVTSFEIITSPVDLSSLSEQVAITERMRRSLGGSGAETIDPLTYLCGTGGTCPTITPSGDPIYRDTMHLRAEYVRSSVLYLDSILGH